jgi:hypothetical protein
MVSLRAPEIDLPGVEWLNTPAPLGLEALRGRIVILDPRIVAKRYGRMFLDSLPDGAVVEMVDEPEAQA